MCYIERGITDVLRSRASEAKCVLVTGARQVGKSTLINLMMRLAHEGAINGVVMVVKGAINARSSCKKVQLMISLSG